MFRYQLFRRFLLFNILVLLLPIWIGSIIQIKTIALLEEKTEQASESSLNRSKIILDERIIEIDRLAKQIFTNKRVRRYASVADSRHNRNIYLASEVLEDLAQYRGLSALVEDFYIYFPLNNNVISSTGKYDLELFLSIHGADSAPGIWRNESVRFGETRKGMQIFRDGNSWPGLGGPYYYFVRGFSYSHSTVPDAVCFIVIRREALESLLGNLAGSGDAFLVGRDGMILAESESGGDRGNPTSLRLPSSVNGWEYEIVRNDDFGKDAVRNIISVTLLVTAVSFVLGLATAYILARVSYTPIKKAIDGISSYTGDRDVTDDIGFLRKRITETLKEDEIIKKSFMSQRGEMRQIFLLRLLNGTAGGGDALQRNMELMGVAFIPGRIIVALLGRDGGEGLAEETMARAIVTGHLEKKLGRNERLYSAELPDGRISLIFNLPGGDAVARSNGLVGDVLSFMENRYHLRFSCGIGSVEKGPDGVGRSFRSAGETLQYLMTRGGRSYMAFDEAQGGENNHYYPMEIERSLSASVQAGDSEKLESILENIRTENLEKRNLSIDAMQLLIFEMIGTAIRVVDAAKKESSAVFGSGFDPFEELMETVSLNGVFTKVSHIYNSLGLYIDESKHSHNDELKEEVESYLLENFRDPGFSQTIMAEELGITPSYLSYFYREQFGENMVQKMNRLRIDEAKRILASEKDPLVSDVAARVGCYSDKSLIRLFRKYENTTPGKYRDRRNTRSGNE